MFRNFYFFFFILKQFHVFATYILKQLRQIIYYFKSVL